MMFYKFQQKLAFSIFILFSIASYPSNSEEKIFPENYAIVPPPKCENNLNELVFYNQIEVQNLSFASGMAKRNDEKKPVVFRINYKKSEPLVQKFIDYHECAHHETGDIDRPHPPRNSFDHLMNESIADCIATLRLRDEDLIGEDEFKLLKSSLVKDMKKANFQQITIESRISNIDNCFLKFVAKKDFLAGVLEERNLKN
jgi:hypothetical protein